MSLHGGILDLRDEFTLDPGLETGTSRPRIRWCGARAGSRRAFGKIAITVEFVAVGEGSTSRDSSS
jgi:hypothetical protein